MNYPHELIQQLGEHDLTPVVKLTRLSEADMLQYNLPLDDSDEGEFEEEEEYEENEEEVDGGEEVEEGVDEAVMGEGEDGVVDDEETNFSINEGETGVEEEENLPEDDNVEEQGFAAETEAVGDEDPTDADVSDSVTEGGAEAEEEAGGQFETEEETGGLDQSAENLMQLGEAAELSNVLTGSADAALSQLSTQSEEEEICEAGEEEEENDGVDFSQDVPLTSPLPMISLGDGVSMSPVPDDGAGGLAGSDMGYLDDGGI